MKLNPINQLSTKLHSTNLFKSAKRGLIAAAIAIPVAESAQSCCPILYGPYYNPNCVTVTPAPYVPFVPYYGPTFIYTPTPCCPPPPPPHHHHHGRH